MMSRTAFCFLSTDASHQCSQATFTSAFHTVQSSNNRCNFIRHCDGASSFHRYKHNRRTRSCSYWSLQTQLDDDNVPSRKRRRRNRSRDTNLNNDDDDITDTVTSILFKPVSIPFSNIIGTNKPRQRVLAIYPLALICTLAVLPPITAAMVLFFSGVYLVLLLPLLDEFDDISLDENNDEQDDDDGRNVSAASLALAYLSAVASAALLSPQGLIASTENEGGLSLSSVPYLLASLLLGLGGFILFSGVNETAKDTRQWEREELDALPERKERFVMQEWDDELKEKEDGLN
mmetsp:Transcript_3129/g.4816  ORF Transcript_3129/g.4816 Transcript_3129/m.4816 type:complete len:290 (-) Transcript_3129:40-909(-)